MAKSVRWEQEHCIAVDDTETTVQPVVDQAPKLASYQTHVGEGFATGQE